MFAQIEYPDMLQPEALDNYLANGWFRMRQTIFTTNFLHFNQQFYSAIWLRVALNDYIPDKKYLTLKSINKGFRIEVKKSVMGAISAQHETLFQYYRQSISFEVSPSLLELLLGIDTNNRFNTFEVNIYDGNNMIAAGFFDMGKTSAAGITSIYHPAYKKYSLGKYLVYIKMEFCKKQDLQYFYPGYVVPGYTAFDYKLELGKTSIQYLQLSTKQWQPYTSFSLLQNPLQEMVEKLTTLQWQLAASNLQCALLYYRFFEANLDPYFHEYELLDFPVFLNCSPGTDASLFYLIVYDLRDAKYHLLHCRLVINIGMQQEYNAIFDSGLLKEERRLFSSAVSEEVSFFLCGLLNT